MITLARVDDACGLAVTHIRLSERHKQFRMADNPASNSEPLQIYRSAPPEWLPKIHSHADLGQSYPITLRHFPSIHETPALQVSMAFNRHDPAKKKIFFPSRTSRMESLSLRPRWVNPLLGSHADNVGLRGVGCQTGRDMECERYDYRRIQRWLRDGT